MIGVNIHARLSVWQNFENMKIATKTIDLVTIAKKEIAKVIGQTCSFANGETISKTNQTIFYRAQQIRSRSACEREGYDYPEIEFLHDFYNLESARECYDYLNTGTEVEKELVYINETTGEYKVIETTWN